MKRTAFICLLSMLALMAAAEELAAEVNDGPQETTPIRLDTAEVQESQLYEEGPAEGPVFEEGPISPKDAPEPTPENDAGDQEEAEATLVDDTDDFLLNLEEEDDGEDENAEQTRKDHAQVTVNFLNERITAARKKHEHLRKALSDARDKVRSTRGKDEKAKAELRRLTREVDKLEAVLAVAVKDCNRIVKLNAQELKVVQSMLTLLSNFKNKKASAEQLEELAIAAREITASLEVGTHEHQLMSDLAEGGTDKFGAIKKLLLQLEKKLTGAQCVGETQRMKEKLQNSLKSRDVAIETEKSTAKSLERSEIVKNKLEVQFAEASKVLKELKSTKKRVEEQQKGGGCSGSEIKKSRDYWRGKAENLAKAIKNGGRRQCLSDSAGEAKDMKDWKDKNHGKFEEIRKANWKHFKTTFENFDYFKVKIKGAPTGKNLMKTCEALKMFTPCDHVGYNNGHCLPTFFQGHLSYNGHHKFPRNIIKGAYFYAGRADRVLQNTGGSHRWSHPNTDKSGYTFCVLPTRFKRSTLVWNNWRFFKVRIQGEIESEEMYKTCEAHGLYTPCCHSSWADGKCVTVNHHGYMSYNRHHNFPRNEISWTYWYSARAHKGFALQNWHNTHRWSIPQESWGEMFCVSPNAKPDPKKVVATWGRDAGPFQFHRVRIPGDATGKNIRRACEMNDLLTVCDHRAYADGHCIVVNWHGHMSYNRHHNFPRNVIDHTYWYAGRRHNDRTLQNWRNTHRWSNHGDMFGDCLCVSKPKAHSSWKTTVQFSHNGYKFYRTIVDGQVNFKKIRAACAKMGLQVPCDHPAYADGHCVTVIKHHRHLSYNRHHNLPRSKVNGCFFYAGDRHQGRALENWRNTHRWSTEGDWYVPTLCVKAPPKPDPHKALVTWRGWKWYKVRIEGVASGPNILKACAEYGYKTPCDHKAYDDGKCVYVGNNGHMSYNRHHNFNRGIIDRTYWYAAKANHMWTLQNWRNTHRWSAAGDIDGDTLCIDR